MSTPAPISAPTPPATFAVETDVGAVAGAVGDGLNLAAQIVAEQAAQADRENAPDVKAAVKEGQQLTEQARIINDEAAAEKNPTPANIAQVQLDSSGVPIP
jgi:hypothetical protein